MGAPRLLTPLHDELNARLASHRRDHLASSAVSAAATSSAATATATTATRHAPAPRAVLHANFLAAAAAGDVAAVQAVAEAAAVACADHREYAAFLNADSAAGGGNSSALAEAARRGDAAMVRILLRCGCCSAGAGGGDASGSRSGSSAGGGGDAAAAAACASSSEDVQVSGVQEGAVPGGAEAVPEAEGECPQELLLRACRCGDAEEAARLMGRGGTPRAWTPRGTAYAMHALACRHEALCGFLAQTVRAEESLDFVKCQASSVCPASARLPAKLAKAVCQYASTIPNMRSRVSQLQ